jgi:hypothetical protein
MVTLSDLSRDNKFMWTHCTARKSFLSDPD